MKSKKKWAAIVIVLLLAVLIGWLIWGNITLEITHYTVTDARIPEGFDGFRIAQVSDLHNTQIGQNNASLLDALAQEKPDIIVITGDLVDYTHTDREVALDFIRRAVTIAPCYFVTGNHDACKGLEFCNAMDQEMAAAGVMVLHDTSILIERNGDTICLGGVDDPAYADMVGGIGYRMRPERLAQIVSPEFYTILLTHRPEHLDSYRQAGMELVLAGHAHGGQVRIPFIGGIWSPDQGFFPKYTAGLYTQGSTTMVVSRGIGNSIFPLRINNRPELVIVELAHS